MFENARDIIESSGLTDARLEYLEFFRIYVLYQHQITGEYLFL